MNELIYRRQLLQSKHVNIVYKENMHINSRNSPNKISHNMSKLAFS